MIKKTTMMTERRHYTDTNGGNHETGQRCDHHLPSLPPIPHGGQAPLSAPTARLLRLPLAQLPVVHQKRRALVADHLKRLDDGFG